MPPEQLAQLKRIMLPGSVTVSAHCCFREDRVNLLTRVCLSRARDSFGGVRVDEMRRTAMEGGLTGFMEDGHMSARTTRQAARARIMAVMQAELNRLFPEDESIPLKGMRLSDFEDQVEELAQAALPAMVEERAALEPNAR